MKKGIWNFQNFLNFPIFHIREGFKKKIWNFPDLVGGWVWKFHSPDLKKWKYMLSKCIKMPKYSFKRNLFFAIWGVSDRFWPTHYTSHALHWPHQESCWSHHASCRPHSTFCRHHVSHTEYDKKNWVNIKFKIFLSVLAFSRVKK